MSRPKTKALWRDESGFTLAEVMIVIVLMGIVLGIASSTWFGIVDSREVDSAANQLAADIRLAHSSAANQLAKYRVMYRSDGSSITCNGTSADYCLVKLDTNSPPSVVKVTPRNLPDGTKIRGSNLAVAPLLSEITGADRAVQLNTNGSAEAVGGLLSGPTRPQITVGTDASSGGPEHAISLNTSTSKVTVD